MYSQRASWYHVGPDGLVNGPPFLLISPPLSLPAIPQNFPANDGMNGSTMTALNQSAVDQLEQYMTSAGLPPKPISMGTVAGETRQGSSQRSRMRQRKIVGRANALKSLESYILSPAQSLPDLANMSPEREEEAITVCGRNTT